MNAVRVGDIEGFFVWGEAQSVRAAETVRHDADVSRRRVEAVDVLREARFRPEALLVAVDGVGEPDRAVRVDDHVGGAVEGAGVVVVDEGGSFVGAFGFHVYQAGGLVQTTLGAEDQAVFVVGTPANHIVALWATDFVAGEVGWGEEFDFGDDDSLVRGCNGVW